MEKVLLQLGVKAKLKIQNSILVKGITLFDLGDRRKLMLTTLVTIFLALFDLLGVMLVGVVTSVAFNGFTSSAQGNTVGFIVTQLGLSKASLEVQISVLATVVVLLFVTKSLVSLYLNRRLLFFLSNRSARLSERLIVDFFDMPLEQLEGRPIQSSIYTLTSAPGLINLGIVGGYIQVVSDVFLLVMMLMGLLFVDVLTTIGIVALYTLLVVLLVALTHGKVARLGREVASLTIKSREGIHEIAGTFRELSVKGKKSSYANQVGKLQYQFAHRDAELNFLSNVSKYVFEIVMIVSISLMVVYQLLTQSASRTVAVSAIFVAASVRIMPAMMRLQQNFLGIRKSFTMSESAFQLIDDVEKSRIKVMDEEKVAVKEFVPDVDIDGVVFGYSDSSKLIFDKLMLKINAGETVGILGKSGVGKSTLVDLILGFLKPLEGSVMISGTGPLRAIKTWPGAISYLPQKTFLVPGTIKKNLSLGFQEERFQEEEYLDVLRAVDLLDDLDKSAGILDFLLDEDATNVSGGQRQRLGIARAILGKPKLLILDESTSSLDKDTESKVMVALREMLPGSTVLMISHRESVLSLCDRVYKLTPTESGAAITEQLAQ